MTTIDSDMAGRIEPVRDKPAQVFRNWLVARWRSWRSERPSVARDRADVGEVAAEGVEAASVWSLVTAPLFSRITMLLALSLSMHMLSLAVPVFVLQVYDRVITHAGMETLIGLTSLVLLALVFEFVLRQARGRLIQLVATRVDVALSRRLFAKLSSLPLRDLETWSQARWHTLLRDGDTVRDTVAGPVTVLLIDIPFVVLFLIVIWTIASPVAWLLMAVIPLFIGLSLLSSFLIDRANSAEQDAAQRRDALVDELVNGRSTLKMLGMMPFLRDRWEQLQCRLILQSVERGGRVDTFTHLAAQAALLTTVLMTCFGALAIINQQMTIGALIAANMLAARVVQPLTRTVSVWRAISRVRRAAGRLDEAIAQPEDVDDSHLHHDRPRGEVRLQNVCFEFEQGQHPVLNGVNLTVRRGLHGIVGANGSGKTTLLKIMQGLYRPQEGRVLIDGGDMAQFGKRDLAQWIGFVPQELFFFDGTVHENIARARPDISDEDIVRAARIAGADAFVEKLPDGYGTTMGEGGARFSSGERQMLAIARALVEDPAILVLDEPTAHLDHAAALGVTKQLADLAKTRTVVVVSHSVGLLQACDTLMVLETGRIAYSGRSADVLARPDRQERRRQGSETDQSGRGVVTMYALDGISERLPLPNWRPLSSIVMVALLVFVVWASQAELNQVATAPGMVVPAGQVRVIQHLEGGIVTDIQVQEGDTVALGQTLVRLDLGATGLSGAEIGAQIDGLLLERARLMAEASGIELTLPDGPSERWPDLARAERETHENRRRQLRVDLDVLRERRVQAELDLEIIDTRLDGLQRQIEITGEQQEITTRLSASQLYP